MKSRSVLVLLAILGGMTRTAVAENTEVVTAVASETGIDLSGMWRYQVVSQVEDRLFAPSTDDSSWPATIAPGRWSDQKIERGDLTVVVYRRTVRVPAGWQGKQIGISAWFTPGSSMVFVNGEAVEAQGPPASQFADVSGLLHYGRENSIAVSTTGDGVLEMAQSGPPLLGPLGQKLITKVVRRDVSIPGPARPMKANLFYPGGAGRLPVVVFAATGHADYSLKDDWHLLNEDLARLGFVSLAVAFNQFSASELEALFQYLAGLEMVDPSRIAFVGAMRATRFVVQAAIANKAVRALVLISSAKIPEIGLLVDRPVLIVCSKGETFAPTLAIARQIADQLTGQRQVVVLPGKSSGVNVLETDWNQFRAETLEWLRKYLGS